MQARFYVPWHGRFASPDPARDQHFEETQSWNIYSYVRNNPVMGIDPTGMETLPVYAAQNGADGNETGEYDVMNQVGAEAAKKDQEEARTTSTNGGAPKTTPGVIPPGGVAPSVTPTTKKKTTGVLDKDNFVAYLDAHAKSKSQGKCAAAVRKGLEAGGMNTDGRPGDAKDYGPFLRRHGAEAIPEENFTPAKGDIAVFGGNDTHVHGHIEAYNGEQWVSDFLQNNFNPYRIDPTPATLYRFPDK